MSYRPTHYSYGTSTGTAGGASVYTSGAHGRAGAAAAAHGRPSSADGGSLPRQSGRGGGGGPGGMMGMSAPGPAPHEVSIQKLNRIKEAQMLKDAWACIRTYTEHVTHRDVWMYDQEHYFPSAAQARKEMEYDLTLPTTRAQPAPPS